MSAVGRGRGRGRGVLSGNSPVPRSGNQVKRPGASVSNNSATAQHHNGHQEGTPTKSGGPVKIKEILDKSDSMKKSEIVKLVLQEVEKNNSKETMEELVRRVCEKSIKDPDFAMLGAEICNRIWVSEELRKYIQTPLLSSVQKKYSTRKELNRLQFYGFVVLLCELFKLLRVKGLPLKPLTKPVCQTLQELLADENPSQDDVLFFFQEMESVGATIESVSVESMEVILNIVRKIVVSNDTILPSIRCRLVQLIELRAAKWKLEDEVRRLYEDLNQDLMVENR